MSIILWTRHFLEAQGYTMKENVVYHDNESAILLEKNGRQSSTKRTRHLEVRYFFVTDNVHRGKLSIEYCPTGDMIAYYFTKPLQGSQFRKMLKQILNIDDALIDSSPQECVGNNKEEPTHAIQDVADESRPRQADSRPVNVVEDSDTESVNTSGKTFMVKNRSYADVVRNQKKVCARDHFLSKLKLVKAFYNALREATTFRRASAAVRKLELTRVTCIIRGYYSPMDKATTGPVHLPRAATQRFAAAHPSSIRKLRWLRDGYNLAGRPPTNLLNYR